MASLRYLWRFRKKNNLFSKKYFEAWAKRLFTLNTLIQYGLRKYNFIFKGAIISSSAEIGKAKLLGHFNNLQVGDNSFIGKAELTLHDKITIGNNVCINDGVILLTASHDVSDPYWLHLKKSIHISDFVWIATNSIILPGVKIGKGAVIGAGSIVSKNVAEFSIVVGNPAKVLKKERNRDLDYNPCSFLAFNSAWLKG
jgi:maltose O-acetyltransferase